MSSKLSFEINSILHSLITNDNGLSNETIEKYIKKSPNIKELNLISFSEIYCGTDFYDFINIYCILKGKKYNINTLTNDMVRVYYLSNKDEFSNKTTFDVLLDIFIKLNILEE
jgi:hypothetical protein